MKPIDDEHYRQALREVRLLIWETDHTVNGSLLGYYSMLFRTRLGWPDTRYLPFPIRVEGKRIQQVTTK